MTFAEHVLRFYQALDLSHLKLPKGVAVLNPYQDAEAFRLTDKFFKKFYSDTKPRKIIIGINPGRFGGGMTGIPFTDPIRLENICGIENNLAKKPELSSDFIYRMIEGFSGPEAFFGDYFISSVSPLGFTKNGKNLNYYDIKELQNVLEPFILTSLRKQITFGVPTDVAFCLGEGQNFKNLLTWNKKEELFKEIIPLPHPRFIMQYRRKRLDEFVKLYINKLD